MGGLLFIGKMSKKVTVYFFKVTFLCVVLAFLMMGLSRHLLSDGDYTKHVLPGFIPENVFAFYGTNLKADEEIDTPTLLTDNPALGDPVTVARTQRTTTATTAMTSSGIDLDTKTTIRDRKRANNVTGVIAKTKIVSGSAMRSKDRKQSITTNLNLDLPGGYSLDNAKSDKNMQYNLIINTYMRSGSSFLGSIFSGRKDVFYVYEPLWRAQKFSYYHGKSKVCHYSSKICSDPGKTAVLQKIGGPARIEDARQYLQNLLQCTFDNHRYFLPDLSHFPDEFSDLKHGWHFDKGAAWTKYHACAKQKSTTYEECFRFVQPSCKKSTHRVLKVLRTTLDNFEPMLETLPNLKVIQLFRDPRGTLNSHLHTPFFSKRVKNEALIEADIEVHCKRMHYDVIAAEKLLQKYPNRFRIVQYEDFSDLKLKAMRLYYFMGMDQTEEIMRNLDKLISSDPKARVGFHPYNYRKTLSWKHNQIAMKYCQKVIAQLGYPIFTDQNDYEHRQDKHVIAPLPYSL